MTLKLVYPAAWTSGMVGRTLVANNPACALRAARMRLHGAGWVRSVPNRFPRAAGTASVRSEIAFRSVR
jgi:hypothetical protein